MEMVQNGLGTTGLVQPLQLNTGEQMGACELRDSKERERLEGGGKEGERKERQWLAGTTQPSVQPGERGGRRGGEGRGGEGERRGRGGEEEEKGEQQCIISDISLFWTFLKVNLF